MDDDVKQIHVLNGALKLYQAASGFKTSTDSVFLGAACPISDGESVLDMGCGVGSAGLCVLKRVDGASLTGFDFQDSHIALAKKNAQHNDMDARSRFVVGDVRDTLDLERFDHVICNPPYMSYGSHKQSPSVEKARAMGHVADDLDLRMWVTRAWHHIKGQGSLTIVHNSEQLDTIIHAMYGERGGRRFGRIEVFPLYSKVGRIAKRVIVRAWKHKQSPLILHPGLIVHDSDGEYTKEAENVLRHAASLF